METEIDEDVEAFRRRMDSIVSDAYTEQRQGVGIIEEIVDFDPFIFEFDVGVPEIQLRRHRPGGVTGACCTVAGQVDPKTWNVACTTTTSGGCSGIYYGDGSACGGEFSCPLLLLVTDSSAAATEIIDRCLYRPFLGDDGFYYVSTHTNCDDPTIIYDDAAPTAGAGFNDACYNYGYLTRAFDTIGCQSGRTCTTTQSYANPFDEALWTSEAFGAIARLTCPVTDDPIFTGVCGDCSVVDPGNPDCIDDTTFRNTTTLSNPVTWSDVFTELFSHLPALPGLWNSGASTDAADFGGIGLCSAFIIQFQYKWALSVAQAFDVTVEWDEDTQVFSADESTLVSETPVHFMEVIPAGFTETSIYFVGVPGAHTSVELINPVIHR